MEHEETSEGAGNVLCLDLGVITQDICMQKFIVLHTSYLSALLHVSYALMHF